MVVVCGHCGGRFEAKRSTARYCSDKCRMAAAKVRKSSSNVVPIAPAAGKKPKRLHSVEPLDIPDPDPEKDDGPAGVHDVLDAIKLTYRRQLMTPNGQVALKLARLIDSAGIADHADSLSRELRMVTTAMDARASANDEEEDPISRARRRHHGS